MFRIVKSEDIDRHNPNSRENSLVDHGMVDYCGLIYAGRNGFFIDESDAEELRDILTGYCDALHIMDIKLLERQRNDERFPKACRMVSKWIDALKPAKMAEATA